MLGVQHISEGLWALLVPVLFAALGSPLHCCSFSIFPACFSTWSSSFPLPVICLPGLGPAATPATREELPLLLSQRLAQPLAGL